jgi:hypothetical protein
MRKDPDRSSATALTALGIQKEQRRDMNPLTNAVLGVVFLVVGAVATVLMYWLRGRPLKAGQKSTQR